MPWYVVAGFALNTTLAIVNVYLRRRWFAVFHGVLAATSGAFLLMVLDSWWECRDGRTPVATAQSDGTMHIDRLCPGQSVDVIVDLRTGSVRPR